MDSWDGSLKIKSLNNKLISNKSVSNKSISLSFFLLSIRRKKFFEETLILKF